MLYIELMTTQTKRRLKLTALFAAGVVTGALICYGWMWWQVYRKFETVWMCQVFTGALSIEEQEYCKAYEADKADGGVRYY